MGSIVKRNIAIERMIFTIPRTTLEIVQWQTKKLIWQ